MPRHSQASQGQSQRKGKRAHDDDDDDDEYNNSSQMPSQSQSSARLTTEEERKGVNRIIKLMLCKDEYKRAVSRNEITTALKGDGVPAGGANVKFLMASATKRLKHVFGFELVEGSKSELYSDAFFSQASQAKKTQEKLYLLKNMLNTGDQAADDADAAAADVEDAAVAARVNLIELMASKQPTDFALTLNVLTMIALSGFKMKESDLLDALRQLDVPLKRGQNLHDVITSLKAQMYIDDVQEKDEEDQKQTFYLPGLRAEKEITRSRMVKFAERVFGEKLSARERSRLLPEVEEEEDEDDMVDV